jgi:PDZ domain-containing protein
MSTVSAPGRIRLGDLKVRRLVGHAALSGCTPRQLRRIAAVADETRIAAGDDLLVQGRVCFWFFLIDDGTAALIDGGDVVGLLGPGAHLGEDAILGHHPNTVTVRALTDVTAFVIASQYFIPLVDDIRALRTRFHHLRRIAPMSRFSRHRFLRRLLGRHAYPRPYSRRRRIRSLLVSAAVIAAATVAGTRYHPGPIVIAPAPAIDITNDITITGVPAHPPTGHYVLTAVDVSRPTAFGLVRALVSSRRHLIISHGTHLSRRAQREAHAAALAVFLQTRLDAAAAAARAAGLPVTVTGTGARITRITPGAAIGAVLAPGDVIVAVGGRPVRTAGDLVPVTPAGARLTVTVERGGARRDVPLVAGADASLPPKTFLGAALETRDRRVELPFQIQFARREVGGPSAGLIYALAITDMLDPHGVARGRIIAATGSIDADGTVGPVGYVTVKADTARHRRAAIFLVPAGQCGEIYEVLCREETDLRSSLSDLR